MRVRHLRFSPRRLGRPVNATDSQSLARSYLYNRRNELAAATIGTNAYEYAYDTIGNRTAASANSVTNTYAANSLNQYTAINQTIEQSEQSNNFSYDNDGNLTQDDCFAYTYDAENRLLSVRPISPTEGALAVVNAYDHKHRRVTKRVERFDGEAWQTVETHTFVYDGGNIVLEKIASPDGTSRTVEYFWGNDLSGSEQGAGGVGGLLAVSIDGMFYFPCYDQNGNVVCYVSESGTIAAQYVFDPYGNVIDQYGNMPDQFAFGFSTKYLDRETGLVGYQRRFYRPDHGRWLNRDPIEEDGGENLYAFCQNNSILFVDLNGMDFWGYFHDGMQMLAGYFSAKAGFQMLSGSRGLALPAYALVAYGLDQMWAGYENMRSRFEQKSLPTGTFIQRTYRSMAYTITGEENSGLKTTLDFAYAAFEVSAACATGWGSVRRVQRIVQRVGPPRSVLRLGVENHLLSYQLVLEAGVSSSKAAGVIIVETFNVVLNFMSLTDPPPSDVENDK